jgi:predicted dehydrogenase
MAANFKKGKTGMKKDESSISRRNFMGKAMATGAVLSIVPRHVLGGKGFTAPSDKLNLAGIGVGGMGKENMRACEGENIVALCDVDYDYAAETFKKYPGAKPFKDYRVMLEKQKDIDAVVIATPDHTHAVIALAAMQMGKSVYVQKPLTHSVMEARKLTESAHRYQVVSQMGNQGHSGEGIRLVCEWIWDGAIGPVREVHAWTNRPIWPQGIERDRPQETPPIPDTLNWDLWVGPATMRPFHPTYLRGKWRGWWDFGTGSLGDMACHIIDPVFWALKLKYPVSVEANGATFWHGFGEQTDPKNEMYPLSTIVRYQFPARENFPEVSMTWWDGGMMPARPKELEPGRRMGDEDGGVLFIGDKGKLMCGCYGASPRLIPETRMKEYKLPPKTLERVPDGNPGHEKDWIRACKEGYKGKPASSNFDYSGPLSETVLMGNLAVRFPYRQLLWDGANMEITNDKDANAYVRQPYREGWE